MAKLIYSAITSLDGSVAGENGNFDCVGREVHAFLNDLERPVGTYLYERRMYETREVAGRWFDSQRPAALPALSWPLPTPAGTARWSDQARTRSSSTYAIRDPLETRCDECALGHTGGSITV